MYNKEDVGDIADVDIKKMGPKKLAKLHQTKRSFRDSVVATFLEEKQKYPSYFDAFGSAIDSSELTAPCNVLDSEMITVTISDSDSTGLYSD